MLSKADCCFRNLDEVDNKLEMYGSESVESKAAIQFHCVEHGRADEKTHARDQSDIRRWSP